MHLLYVCDASSGGIAEYAIRQMAALTDVGIEVTFLCRPGFPTERLCGCRVDASLPQKPKYREAWGKVIDRIRDGRTVAKAVVNVAVSLPADAVLIACFAEYFSPLWAGTFRSAVRRGLKIGTIAHDPVRDFVLGPLWWHRWSVRQAYSFVSDVFVHDGTVVDFGGPPPPGVRTHKIPHGPFEVPPATRERAEIRAHYGFSDSDRIFLAFGQIRDGKNLDRFLRAMKDLPPEVKLLVAGSGGGGSQRSPDEYQRLARESGVGDRCAWDLRYIPEDETGDFFAAADCVLMTYSAKFRSASGVMNSAVACRKPMLASSGAGPLKSSVEGYRLGVWIPPDDDASILAGVRRLLAEPIVPEWERYERENSWEENAKRVIEAFRA